MSYPKVSLKEVEDAIVKEDYTVLQDGRTTICLLTLDNGFTVRGESSCVHQGNFVKELGEEAAKKKALDEVWAFLGFRLAEKLHAASVPSTWFTRLLKEREELGLRIESLEKFTDLNGRGLVTRRDLGHSAFSLLTHQLYQMKQLADTLDARIELAKQDHIH